MQTVGALSRVIAAGHDPLPSLQSAKRSSHGGLHLAERRAPGARAQLLRRVAAEFSEMPGLSLTFAQATRLLGLREDICLRVLATLIGEGTLRRTRSGLYVIR
jgi:hypothetical protein